MRTRSTHTGSTGGSRPSGTQRRVQPLEPGEIIGRRFCALRKLAAGAMGEVWAGEHTQLRLPVALKVLRKEALQNPEIVARFTREAFLLGQVRSQHVARVLDFVMSAKHGPVLVMELVEGDSMHTTLAANRLTHEVVADLGIEVLRALRELHAAHVIHRDVKPANIILQTRRDGSRRAVFVDLGVSRFVADEPMDEDALTEITSADRAVGTIEYMAPEQILSSRDVTAASDIYAIGAMLYRALTRSADERYATADEMLGALMA